MGQYPYKIKTVTISSNMGVLNSTSLEVLDLLLVAPADNAGSIYVRTDASSGTGFAIAKGTSVTIPNRVNLVDFTLSGANSDKLGVGYHL